MSVQTQIDRISGAVSAALTALAEKGVTVPAGTKVDGLAALIAAIEAGGGGSGGGSGGDSGVISAVATGTYTPASDISYGAEIEHGLGVTPNFCIWMAENDFSDITGVSAVVVGAMVAKPMLYSASSGMTLHNQYFLRGYTSSGTANGTTSYKDDDFMTDTIVTILGNNTYKLKSGWTYRWVAGVINA